MKILQQNAVIGLSLFTGYKIATKAFRIDLDAKTFAIYNLCAIVCKAGSINTISLLRNHFLPPKEDSKWKECLELLTFVTAALVSSKISTWIAQKSTNSPVSWKALCATRIIHSTTTIAVNLMPYFTKNTNKKGKNMPQLFTETVSAAVLDFPKNSSIMHQL